MGDGQRLVVIVSVAYYKIYIIPIYIYIHYAYTQLAVSIWRYGPSNHHKISRTETV